MSESGSFDYIRKTYGRDFFKGQRVRVRDGGEVRGFGSVTGATHYVEVMLDGDTWSDSWHPTDVEPVDEGWHDAKDDARLEALAEETARAAREERKL